MDSCIILSLFFAFKYVKLVNFLTASSVIIEKSDIFKCVKSLKLFS